MGKSATHRKLIYHPSGKAGEYADKGFAVNLFKGCTHGCKYCYVPAACHVPRETFHSSSVAAPDVLQRLEKDMKRVGILPEPIFLCFTCDPYVPNAHYGITREAIDIIVKSGNRVNILTKGGTKAIKDFGVLERSKSKIGATLTFFSDSKSLEWEPGAALPGERAHMLRAAWDSGIETWASIEPVIDPLESLAVMEAVVPFVDTFKIGKWNYDPRAKEIDWKGFALKAKVLMERSGKRYMFKKELREAIA